MHSYLHQLDRQDGGAHQSPLGLLWLGEGGERGGGALRPSGHITGLPLITSCHIDESSVRAALPDAWCGCAFGLPHPPFSPLTPPTKPPPQNAMNGPVLLQKHSLKYTQKGPFFAITVISLRQRFLTDISWHQFGRGGWGGTGGDVGAHQMQNSTPAVLKHPRWVQISAPLLLVLPSNALPALRDNKAPPQRLLLNLLLKIWAANNHNPLITVIKKTSA